jgi:MaoC like domain
MTNSIEATAERRFSEAGQLLFADLSGDSNPMHMDALAARRTQAGAPVVHGVHAVLWALDRLAADIDLSLLAGITVSLNRFIYLDRPVTVRVTRRTDASIAADVIADGVTVITLLLKLGPRSAASAQNDFLDMDPADMACAAETPEELKDARGWLSPPSGAGALASTFPRLTQMIGVERVTGLALLSTLVGMACPGLHSIFTAFQAEMLDDISERRGIGFYVRVADPRFRVVRMAVGGNGVRATVSAFVRMPPMLPPAMVEVVNVVKDDEFAGQRVLIVGGSRGLGALSARIVAAGGGEVVLTYARGVMDAGEVAANIHAHRTVSACAVYPMDVAQELGPQLAVIPGGFSGLLYFATPQIRRQKPAVFMPAVHEEFFQYYVRAFLGLTTLLLGRDAEAKLDVFYPSSVAVVERPEDMTEYAMAKAAGEVLAADLAAADPRLHMVIDRLGRLPTDQNATVVQAEFEDLVGTMLPLLRKTLRG